MLLSQEEYRQICQSVWEKTGGPDCLSKRKPNLDPLYLKTREVLQFCLSVQETVLKEEAHA
mgnify:CR=1 FL=1